MTPIDEVVRQGHTQTGGDCPACASADAASCKISVLFPEDWPINGASRDEHAIEVPRTAPVVVPHKKHRAHKKKDKNACTQM